jgi:hypothetical protein
MAPMQFYVDSCLQTHVDYVSLLLLFERFRVVFLAFSSFVRQMLEYNTQRRGTART